MNLTRREFLKRSGAAAVLGAAGTGMVSSAQASGPHPPSKPNIIYVLSDDLGYGDLGCYGQKKIRTPHLDRLASEGVRFTQHYAGATVCAPSRCSLMTGKHTGHCSVRGNISVLMKPGEPTLGTVLKQAGYATGYVGKWGVGHGSPEDEPRRFGFDHFFGYLSMWHAHMSYPEFLYRNGRKIHLANRVVHPASHYQEGQAALTGYAIEKHEYSPDLFAEDALAFIGNHRAGPFFLFFSPTIPHANNEAFMDFRQPGMEVPVVAGTQRPDYGIYRDRDWPEPEKAKAAMISRLDDYVGRILAKLKELGLSQNTLVIFSSDNGPHKEGGIDPDFFVSSGPFRGVKRDLYDGGIRVPLIARWPARIESGRITDQVCAFWDMLPTFAEFAGTAGPSDIDGISMAPSLFGQPQTQHAYLYWEFHEGASAQAVRMGDWKAVRTGPDNPIEIYDLKSDAAESQNIAEQHPEMVAKVRRIFVEARTAADRWPLMKKIPPVK